MKFAIKGDWELAVGERVFAVTPPPLIRVEAEAYESLPLFQPQEVCGWRSGTRLTQVIAAECTRAGALQPDSVEVRTIAGEKLRRGVDYEFDAKWGALGRLAGGALGAETPAQVSYAYIPMRLDTVFRKAGGTLRYAAGKPAVICPAMPAPEAGEERVLNILLDHTTAKLTREAVYPVLETAYPGEDAVAQQRFIPRSIARLKAGGPLHILCWGDSVTEGAYLADPADRWPSLLLEKLRRKYPANPLEVAVHGWGGRSVTDYLAEVAGAAHNFVEKIADAGADLVISEFVNDALLPPEAWAKSFPAVLAEFRRRNIEWIILTPHYVRPDWMGLEGQNGEAIENDPRPYVKFLRDFAAVNGVALADAAKRYGRLWRQGIPYQTLMTNDINHPDRRGMMIFADALDAIF
ncbi:MAG: SGNH/GDSL hydrolase family protein [Victivallaceae bacterium]